MIYMHDTYVVQPFIFRRQGTLHVIDLCHENVFLGCLHGENSA